MSFDPTQVAGLNVEVFDRWLAYKKVRKEAYKDVSLPALALKLSRYGDKQAEVVEQSIANNWSGLFEIREARERNNPHEPKKRTDREQAAADASFDFAEKASNRHWDDQIAREGVIAKLRFAAALFARYDCQEDQSSPLLAEKRAWLRDRTIQLLREVDPALALRDLHILRLVLVMFGYAGQRRLEERAAQHKESA